MLSVITVENLSKKYIIGHQKQERYSTLRDVLADGAKHFAQKLRHYFATPQNDPNQRVERLAQALIKASIDAIMCAITFKGYCDENNNCT